MSALVPGLVHWKEGLVSRSLFVEHINVELVLYCRRNVGNSVYNLKTV